METATDSPARPARVVSVDSHAPAPAVLAEAATLLRADDLVAFPTETFYGLGAAALAPAAVRRLVEVKGRPEHKPLLVLIDSIAMAERVVADLPPRARELMARLGVRLSAHPLARALVSALGEPITAPSANPSGLAPPTTAAEVAAYFGDRVALVLDGGATPGGEPSTVVDVTRDPPRVVRAGAVRI
ncbi:MAG: L-threonylcarbamoyladenylate synthase [Candidatus Rokuibacteriota bacterium]|nr:MAG: L-threonylcarbamoyladenylate synthase [Candidatus Rokubacteria bacterium]